MVPAFSYYYLKGFGSLRKRVKGVVIAAASLAVISTVIAHYPSVLKLPPDKDPTSRLVGWQELGERVSKVAGDMEKKGGYFIVSDRYQITSELAFYVAGNPVTYCANTGRRMNQYDLWPGFEGLLDYNAIYVSKKNRDIPASLRNAFENCEREEFNVFRKSVRVNWFGIFRCYDFKGMEKPPLSTF